MPGVKFSLTEEQRASLKLTQQKLMAARDQIRDMKPIHGKVATFLDQWVQDNFKSQGGNIPGGWEPFAFGGRIRPDGSADTTAKLLQDTGRLRASFVPFADGQDAGIGSDLPYAETHQKGSPANNLPDREMLPKMEYTTGRGRNQTVRDRILSIFDGHVTEIFDDRGIKVDK